MTIAELRASIAPRARSAATPANSQRFTIQQKFSIPVGLSSSSR